MQVRNIPLADIVASELNPRKTFDQEALEELAQSIKENGLIQPITVRKLPKGREAKYEIVCGERRFRACQIIGESNIDAVVKDLDDKQAFAAMIIENLQRQNVDPMEEAAALNRLFNEGAVTVAQIARMLGKSTSFVFGRIQLYNTIPQFVQLMRDGVLVLTHLLDICKLPKEQQEILYETCFTEASRARWAYKFPNMPQLHEMIDEHVMNFLAKAKFSVSDESFEFAPACEDCPLNTKNNPENYRDANNPRCMKRECFMRKNQIAVFRAAKESCLQVVFSGTYPENETIIRAAEEFGLEPMGIGNRSYVLAPKAPDEAAFQDKATYEARFANYQKVRSVFDDNIADGTVTPVFEISYDGHLSGEVKYVFAAPNPHEEVFEASAVENNNKRISDLKTQLRECNDKRRAEMVEKQRAFMEVSEYSTLNTDLSDTERKVFYALVMKRLPAPFKESLGCTNGIASDYRLLDEIIGKNLNSIIREFIRGVLSEKSVNYSDDLANMVNAIMEDRYGNKADEINEGLAIRYDQMKNNIQVKIDEIRAENAAAKAKKEEPADTQEAVSEESPAEESNEKENVPADAPAEVAEEVSVAESNEPAPEATEEVAEESNEAEKPEE